LFYARTSLTDEALKILSEMDIILLYIALLKNIPVKIAEELFMHTTALFSRI